MDGIGYQKVCDNSVSIETNLGIKVCDEVDEQKACEEATTEGFSVGCQVSELVQLLTAQVICNKTWVHLI
jgi:hypothetical protein